MTYNGAFDSITGDIGSVPDCTATAASTGCCGGDKAATPAPFQLDADHQFECCVPTPVSGNTFLMLRASRFAPLFGFKVASTEPACCSTAAPKAETGCCGGDAPTTTTAADVDLAPTLENVDQLQRFDFAAAQARIGAAPCCGTSCCPEWTADWPFDDTVGEESGADGAGGGCDAASGCC